MPTIEQSRKRAVDERLQVHKISDTEYRAYNPTKGTSYALMLSGSGQWTCTCPFMTKGSHVGTSGVCKHLVALADILVVKQIKVGNNGKYALVDPEDFNYLNQFTWSELQGRKTTYARRTVRFPNGKQKTILMHKEIIDSGIYREVDHINNNGLDNRKCNLRLATASQHRSRHYMPRDVSKYRGVYRMDTKTEKYCASINIDGKKTYLGSYSTDIEAAKAYDKAAKSHYGEFATVNFP